MGLWVELLSEVGISPELVPFNHAFGKFIQCGLLIKLP